MRKGIVAAAAALTVLVALFAALGGSAQAGRSTDVEVGAKGDIDCDGQIGLADMTLFLELLSGVREVSPDCSAPASGDLADRLDIDCDGNVDDGDVLPLLLFLGEIESPLPTGCPPIGAPPSGTPTETPNASPGTPTPTPPSTPTPTASPPLSLSVVNTTSDHDPNGCHQSPGDCTLREAILALTAGGNVTFAIPGSGVHIIKPTTSLPAISVAGVTVNGYTQPGSSPNSAGPWEPGNAEIRIVIDGSENTEPNGAGLYVFAPNVTVRGLSIVNSPAEGIKTGTLIGGLKIAGNYIGVMPDGETAGPNGLGIELRSSESGNILGGGAPADRNVWSGNTGDGIWVDGGAAVVVAGNFVGTNAAGDAAVPNGGYGIHMDGAPHSTVGGNTAGTGNLASGNLLSGIGMTSTDANSSNVKGNRVGTAADGLSPLPNHKHGVYLATGAHDNTIGGEFNFNEQNIIAYNTMAGVALSASAGANNYVDPNITRSNGGLGTDLKEDGVTLNDADDSDAGPNNMMNFPVIDSADYDGTTLHVTGHQISVPNSYYNSFVFVNSSCDPSGYGEGERFLGSIGFIIGATGRYDFDKTNVPNPPLTSPTWVTMSASDPESSSEFSLCFQVNFTNP